jgi:hypothetical protein
VYWAVIRLSPLRYDQILIPFEHNKHWTLICVTVPCLGNVGESVGIEWVDNMVRLSERLSLMLCDSASFTTTIEIMRRENSRMWLVFLNKQREATSNRPQRREAVCPLQDTSEVQYARLLKRQLIS